ncbi:MAG: hypothetical protein K0S61_2153 [Anaerocolumna sp.]|jgi:2-polyprenyl-3-methyl-5-hydroxy-6-metoxy-1,4-benzoquinol methylase|nr:hypothetical protein [Anaerocolumna sp.]
MAQQGTSVTAVDLSTTAIENAKILANNKNINISFLCQDALKSKIVHA